MSDPGDYKQAKGALPWKAGDELPEDAIRRLRDNDPGGYIVPPEIAELMKKWEADGWPRLEYTVIVPIGNPLTRTISRIKRIVRMKWTTAIRFIWRGRGK